MLQSEILSLLEDHHSAFARHDAAALAEQHLEGGMFESPAVGIVHGREAIRQVYHYWFTAFPDMRFSWGPPIVDGNRAALFWILEGTVEGPFFGVPNPGTRVRVTGAAQYIFQDGGILSAAHVFDFSSLLMKTGILKARPA
jgi:predicted ester cyclase